MLLPCICSARITDERCDGDNYRDCAHPHTRRTFIASGPTCQLFAAGSGVSMIPQSGSASDIVRPLTALNPSTPTGCSGGFCNFVPNNAVIRWVLRRLMLPVRIAHLSLKTWALSTPTSEHTHPCTPPNHSPTVLQPQGAVVYAEDLQLLFSYPDHQRWIVPDSECCL